MVLHPEMLGFTFQKNFFPESYALIKLAISRIIYIYISLVVLHATDCPKIKLSSNLKSLTFSKLG